MPVCKVCGKAYHKWNRCYYCLEEERFRENQAIHDARKKWEAEGGRHPSYKEQDGCENCGHVFRLYDHDGDNQYFCHVDKSKRPQCGSVAMSETYPERLDRWPGKEWDEMTDAEKDRLMQLDHIAWGEYDDQWLAWSEPREVTERGICDEWIPQEASSE